MRELSLFTGAGGGLLAGKLIGLEPVGYVEYNDYCQRVIRARIEDGLIPNAPIFGDIDTFIGEGYAEAYQGMVDVVTGGFPCQPFSVAGKGEGENDPRNKWPATIEVIRLVRPRFCLLENVPGLFAHEYIRTIFRELAEIGYILRWRILSAAEVGAPHKRDRVWILATNTESKSGYGSESHTENGRAQKPEFRSGDCSTVANTKSKGLEGGAKAGHAQKSGKDGEQFTKRQSECGIWGDCEVEPAIRGVDDGLGSRVERLKALGNGWVPQVAAKAWELLT